MTTRIRSRALVFVALMFVAAACGPAMHVKPIGTRVDALPPPTPTPAPGAEAALPPSLPGGWRLTGGPADYTAATLAQALGDEAGRFRGTKSYASAEYGNFAQRVITVEAFVMSSPDAAKAALEVGTPADAKPLTGDEIDAGYAAGLRALARRGSLLVRVHWYEEKDDALHDAAIDALMDVAALGEKVGLTGTTAPTPAPAPTASPAPTAPAAPASTATPTN